MTVTTVASRDLAKAENVAGEYGAANSKERAQKFRPLCTATEEGETKLGDENVGDVFCSVTIRADSRSVASGEAQECPNEGTTLIRAEAMLRKPPNVGALAFKRSGTLDDGKGLALILRTFGEVASNLDEL